MTMQYTPAQLTFHKEHKERLARQSAAASRARASMKRMAEARRVVIPAEPVTPPPPQDAYAEAVKKAVEFIGPRPRDYIHVSSPHRPQPSLRQIMREVIDKYGITEVELLSIRRKKHLCTARHEFCWRAKNETSQSYPQIARFLGNRDHTTAMSSVYRYQWMLDNGKL